MSKRITVRWYTNDMKYLGWNYITNASFNGMRHWLRSGNCLKIGNEALNSFTSTTKLLNLFK
jgi:hypothetical protein